MTAPTSIVYVISDLHLGGEPGPDGQRGFRMCTQTDALAGFIGALASERPAGSGPSHSHKELVINGDFVDFLAERTADAAFSPLKEDPEQAAALFQQVLRRNQAVFAALRQFVAAGHTLTLLLGNHDIELAFPAVRAELAAALGVPAAYLPRFFYDGEAYVVGDALIEHGNRYDAWNSVDHDALRRVLALQSRRQAVPGDLRLPPPPGSQLVAEIMNPIKADYPFIDLLKPESAAAVPLLLALDPSHRVHVGRLARLALATRGHTMRTPAMPTRSGDIAAGGGSLGGATRSGDIAAVRTASLAGGGSDDAALAASLDAALGPGGGAAFLRQLDGPPAAVPTRGDISSRGTLQGAFSLLRLLTSSRTAEVESRLAALRVALRTFCEPRLFELDYHHERDPYVLAATELAAGGRFSHVVFGHTHLARSLPLGDDGKAGGRYLNSGTWADLIRVPDDVFAADEATSTGALRRLVDDLAARRIDGLIWRRPTYARLIVEGDRVVEGSVETYRGGHGDL